MLFSYFNFLYNETSGGIFGICSIALRDRYEFNTGLYEWDFY